MHPVLAHYGNVLHIYCRLIDWHVSKKTAFMICRFYERYIWSLIKWLFKMREIMKKINLKYFVIVTMLLWAMALIFAMDSEAKTVSYSLQWDANSESDLAGYKIYIGLESRVYGDAIIPTGDQALAVIYEGSLIVPDDDLTTYYFAVTAYDTAGLESDYSNEVSYEFDTRVAPTAPQNLKWYEKLIAWVKKHWKFWS